MFEHARVRNPLNNCVLLKTFGNHLERNKVLHVQPVTGWGDLLF